VAYKLEISKAAQADFAKLDKPVLLAIRQRLLILAENAEQVRHLALKGKLAGLYKLRVYGKYRIIYELQRESS
jgi:mRNA-degrading endonuclease RelE of RelBE toxin-antitoxin system